MDPLLLAALRGDKETLIIAVACGVNLIEVLGDHSETLIHAAAKGGHKTLIEWLLVQGLKLEETDEQSRNVVHYAAAGGHHALVVWLAKNKNLDPWLEDHSGNDLLNYAAKNGKKDFILSIPNYISVCKYRMLNDLAFGGLQEILTELMEREKGRVEQASIILSAIRGGHFQLYTWLYTKDGFNKREETAHYINRLTVLQNAAEGGHQDLIDHFVVEESDMKLKGRDGRSLLHYAALGGRLQLIKSWVSKGIFDITETDNNGITIGHLAAQGNHKELITWLSRRSLILHQKDKNGRNILHYAALYGHRSLLQYLAEDLAFNYLEEKDVKSMNVLHCAAQKGYQPVVKWLIEKKGLNINDADSMGKTPLHYALDGHYEVLIKWLVITKNATLQKTGNDISDAKYLEYQASIEWVITLKDIALQYKRKHRSKSEIYNDDSTIATWSLPISNRKFSDLKEIAPLNCKDREGRTMLHFAAYAGCMAMLKLYQEQFFVPELAIQGIKDNEGKTAFHYAAEGGQIEVMELSNQHMLKYIVTYEGKNLLHSAAQCGQQALIDWLIEKKHFDLTKEDKHGKTALHYAAEGGHYQLIISWVNKNKFHLMDCDEQGRTVLHFAAYHGHQQLIEQLSKHPDFNIHAKTYHDRTALHYAAMGKQEETFEWLVIEHELSIDEKDKKQTTPMNISSSECSFIYESLRIHKENKAVLLEAEKIISEDLSQFFSVYNSEKVKEAMKTLGTESFPHEHRLILLQFLNESPAFTKFSDFREKNNFNEIRFLADKHKKKYGEMTKKIQEIESAYQKIIQHPEIQDNWVRVRVWESGQYPNPKNAPAEYRTNNNLLTVGYQQIERYASSNATDNTNVGHVSVETARGYMSFWPSGDKAESFQGRKARMNNSLLDDKLAEGPHGPNNQKIPAEPQMDEFFYSLDSKKIDKKCDEILKKIYTKELQYAITNAEHGSSSTRFANCVTISYELLITGEIGGLISMVAPSNITLPYGLKIQVAAAVQEEKQQFPIVKSFRRPQNDEAFPYAMTKEKKHSLYQFIKDYRTRSDVLLPQGTALWGKYIKSKLAYELIDDNDCQFEISQVEADVYIKQISIQPLEKHKMVHKQ